MTSSSFSEQGKNIPVPCGNVTLEGDMVIPENAPGIVLFAHGSGSSRYSRRNQAAARVINGAGLGTLLFDLLTAKEEVDDIDTFRFRFDMHLLAGRLEKVSRWIAECMPQLRIGYFGSSTGGGAALMAAAELGDKISAIVSRGGRPDLAGSALHRVLAPTLLIVGECDETVLKINEAALTRLRCEKSLSIVPGATHLFIEPGALEEVARLSAQWFRFHLHS